MAIHDQSIREPSPFTLSERDRKTMLLPVTPPNLVSGVILLILLAAVIWSMTGIEISGTRLWRGIPHFIDFFAGLWPPNQAYFTEMWPPIRDTIQMAIAGLAISMVAALPLSLLAANNTSPHPVVYQATRMFLNVVRAIPSLIWAVIVVSSIGFGPFSGVLALAIAGIGTLGKLYSEAIESINPRQVEALTATGAGPAQVFSFAVLPQAMPLLISYSLLDFESNIRSATILGVVGAGGIGFELLASFSQFKFHEVFTILILIVVLVTVVDRMSDFIRSRLI